MFIKSSSYEIIIACDHPEAESFCDWLLERGFYASIGNTTGNYFDGVLTSSDPDASEIFNRLWDEYCAT